MRYSALISKSNLELAWRRLATGRNVQYKRFYRPLYLAYEVAYKENLDLLHQRLKGAWQPSSPQRVFLPKASGLQRPISLLELEDQIVYQAVANVFAEKLRSKRREVERKAVYSNILNTKRDSIFFTKDWYSTYRSFVKKNESLFKSGNHWVAQFDFAAFYDTISHELLLKSVAPKGGYAETWDTVRQWLECWSTVESAHSIHHGIPQGPIASDFLAECLLLPLDLALMKKGYKYVRYVDDIRFFASSPGEAQAAAIQLEIEARNLGLIPQSGKFKISRVRGVEELTKEFISHAPPDRVATEENPSLSADEAVDMFEASIDGKPLRVVDASTAKYVLYRAPQSPKLRARALLLLPRHPELFPAFVHYLNQYGAGLQIERTISEMIRTGVPYTYMRGELWRVLAKITPPDRLHVLRPFALRELREESGCIALKWGAMSYLFACQRSQLGKVNGRMKTLPPLLQALLVPELPDSAIEDPNLIQRLLKQPQYGPSMVLAEQFLTRDLKHSNYSVRARELPSETQNVFRSLGLIQRPGNNRVDQVGEILQRRYGIAYPQRWRPLLNRRYMQALGLLVNAEAVFDAGRSHWLQLQNSFNDLLLRELIDSLKKRGLPGARSLVDRNGRLIKFGSLLDPNSPFPQAHPRIASGFRNANDRRNKLPNSHPFDEKTGNENKPLRKREQAGLVTGLINSYQAIEPLLP